MVAVLSPKTLTPGQEAFKNRRAIYLELRKRGTEPTKMGNLEAFWVTIDPFLGSQILGSCLNEDNQRKRAKAHIALLTRQMKAGDFKVTGDPVRFNDLYEFCDGQHRISALVDSGTTQTFLVVGNLPEDRMSYIDQNAKTRSLSDRIKIASGVQLTRLEQGVFQALVYGMNGDNRSIHDNLEKWQQVEHAIRFVCRPRVKPTTHILSKASVRAVVARAYLAGESVERLEQFLHCIDTQLADSPEDSAALILSREYRRPIFSGSSRRQRYEMHWDSEYLLRKFLDRKPVSSFPRRRARYVELWDIEGLASIPPVIQD